MCIILTYIVVIIINFYQYLMLLLVLDEKNIIFNDIGIKIYN